jgi:hypothetical protein
VRPRSLHCSRSLGSLVAAVVVSAGCGSTWRAGPLVVSDEHGHVGAVVSLAVGGGLGDNDEASGRRSSARVIAADARGGVLDGAPSGIGEFHLGLDFVELWGRAGFRAGAFGGGGLYVGPGRGHGVGSVGARTALLLVLRARTRRLRDPIAPCWFRGVAALGIEASASYLFGPNRALFSFGPMYEWVSAQAGNCD